MNPSYFVSLVENLKGTYRVKEICQALQVPISTYYRWKKKDFTRTGMQLFFDTV
ncbi:transposase [Listeria seeligeri FSL N1-067]|uniref:Transposase n=1 Tax=Listeria seeligeri FSL N1-067 TaxID=702453 RepID=E3ZN59_LISSE|nr:transposase [Listeria seeligeri FSL N1-067]